MLSHASVEKEMYLLLKITPYLIARDTSSPEGAKTGK